MPAERTGKTRATQLFRCRFGGRACGDIAKTDYPCYVKFRQNCNGLFTMVEANWKHNAECRWLLMQDGAASHTSRQTITGPTNMWMYFQDAPPPPTVPILTRSRCCGPSWKAGVTPSAGVLRKRSWLPGMASHRKRLMRWLGAPGTGAKWCLRSVVPRQVGTSHRTWSHRTVSTRTTKSQSIKRRLMLPCSV